MQFFTYATVSLGLHKLVITLLDFSKLSGEWMNDLQSRGSYPFRIFPNGLMTTDLSDETNFTSFGFLEPSDDHNLSADDGWYRVRNNTKLLDRETVRDYPKVT